MKSYFALHIEELEARDTPAPLTGGLFLPPGIIHTVGDPHQPPPVQENREGAIRFVPPGLIRGVGDPHLPAPVDMAGDGALTFLPPGVIRGFDPQPDPPAA